MSERSFLLCCSVTPTRLRPPVHGALQKTCADCAGAVWVSPMSLQTIAEETKGDFVFLCIRCASASMLKAKTLPKVMPISEAQVSEMSRELKRRELAQMNSDEL